jgi:Cu(I)-responsive transcriptional regulator
MVMNIGRASQQAGIAAKMIRYYESIGLLPEADRRKSGYRDYSDEDVSRLKFLRRARSLGFSVPQIKELMRLWSDRSRSNAEVRELPLNHAAELEQKARQLQEMIETLRRLSRACQRGDRPQCPIIEELGGGRPMVNGKRKTSKNRTPGYAS